MNPVERPTIQMQSSTRITAISSRIAMQERPAEAISSAVVGTASSSVSGGGNDWDAWAPRCGDSAIL